MSRGAAHIIAVLAVGACAFTACDPSGTMTSGDENYFSAFTSPRDGAWLYTEPAVFCPDTLLDSVAAGGTLLLSVRHTGAYPYRNLWLELSYPEDDSTIVADTLNLILADVYGNWTGKGMGVSWQYTDTVSRDYTIVRKRPLTLRHIMRVDRLEGIEQVGLIYLPKE